MAEKSRAAEWSRSAQEWVAFCGWVVIFLIGPATPQLLKQWDSPDDLHAVYEGPVYFSGRAAYSLDIQNGAFARHRVRVRAPMPPGGDVLFAAGPYETPRALETHDEPGYRVLELGDMNPGEHYALGVNTTWTAGTDPAPWVMAQVVSAERTASTTAWRYRAYRDEANLRWYEGAFDLMSAAVVLLVILVFRKPAQQAPPVKQPVPREAWRRPASRPRVLVP